MNRRFRMISLMSEALSLELEDVLERDASYEKSFQKEFAEEIRYLMDRQALERRNGTPSKIEMPMNEEIAQTNKKEQSGIVKDIYRTLAKHTHPDVSGSETEEEFKAIQNAYSSGDIVGLLSAANRRGVAPELSDEDLGSFKPCSRDRNRP